MARGRGSEAGRRRRNHAVWRGLCGRIHRQVHVLGELRLVGAAATDLDAATLAGGDGCAVGQGDGRVAAVPADDERPGSGAVPEAAGQQSAFLVSGVEPVTEHRSIGRGVADP